MYLSDIKLALLRYKASQWRARRATRLTPNSDIARLSDLYASMYKRHGGDHGAELSELEERQIEALITRRSRWKKKSGEAFSFLHRKVKPSLHRDYCADDLDENIIPENVTDDYYADHIVNRYRQFENFHGEVQLMRQLKSFAEARAADQWVVVETQEFAHVYSEILYQLTHIHNGKLYDYPNFVAVLNTRQHAIDLLEAVTFIKKNALDILTNENFMLLTRHANVAVDLALLMVELHNNDLLNEMNLSAALNNKEHISSIVWYVQNGLSDCPDEYQDCLDVLWQYAPYLDNANVINSFREAANESGEGFDLSAFKGIFVDSIQLDAAQTINSIVGCIEAEREAYRLCCS